MGLRACGSCPVGGQPSRSSCLLLWLFGVVGLGCCIFWAGDPDRDLRDAAQRIVAWQRADRPVLIIGTFGELSPPLFGWRLRPLPVFAHTTLPIQYDAPPVEGPDDIARVKGWLEQNAGAQVTVILVEPWSPLHQAADMQNKNLWRQRLVRAFDEVRTHRLADEVIYAKIGLSIRYYLPSQP